MKKLRMSSGQWEWADEGVGLPGAGAPPQNPGSVYGESSWSSNTCYEQGGKPNLWSTPEAYANTAGKTTPR